MKTYDTLCRCAFGALMLAPIWAQASDADHSALRLAPALYLGSTGDASAPEEPRAIHSAAVTQKNNNNALITVGHRPRHSHHTSQKAVARKRISRHFARNRLRCMQVRYEPSRSHRHRCASFLLRKGMLARPRIRL